MHDSASTKLKPQHQLRHRRFSWCCSFAVPSQSPDHHFQHRRQNHQQHYSVSTHQSRSHSLSKHFHNPPSQKTELPSKSAQSSFPNSPQSQASNTSSSSKLGLRRILSPGRVSPIDDAVAPPASTSIPSAEVPKLPLSDDIDAPHNAVVSEEGAVGIFDVRLSLKGRNGGGSLVLELSSEILAANSTVFADLIADCRSNSKGLCRIEVPEVDNLNVFRETIELMFDEDVTSRLLKIGVYRVIDILEVGAIEGDEELTPLGHHLAKFPVDVLIGKMLIYGGIFGCLSPILSISAFLSYKSPFLYPKDEKQNVERAKLALLTNEIGGATDGNRQSDHLLMMVAYKKWEKIFRESGAKAAQHFCISHFLSSSVMYMIRDMRIQFAMLLADIGLIDIPKHYKMEGKKKDKLDSWLSDASQVFNIYSNNSSIVKAILCAGLYPNVAATEEGIVESAVGALKQNARVVMDGRYVWYDRRREVHIHPSSINHNLKKFQYPFLVFLEKVETNKVFLRDTTIISPNSILLFGGSINVQHQTGLVTIDGWLKMAAPAQTAVLFKELRLTLHSILKELISKPQAATFTNNEVLKSIIHLFLEEERQAK